jgi:hypothetical protein
MGLSEKELDLQSFGRYFLLGIVRIKRILIQIDIPHYLF